MGIKSRRKVLKLAKYSRAITLPSNLEVGNVATMAGNRLILVDPRGEISEQDLLEFLEAHIEPNFWPWIAEKEKKNDSERKD